MSAALFSLSFSCCAVGFLFISFSQWMRCRFTALFFVVSAGIYLCCILVVLAITIYNLRTYQLLYNIMSFSIFFLHFFFGLMHFPNILYVYIVANDLLQIRKLCCTRDSTHCLINGRIAVKRSVRQKCIQLII